MDKNICDIFSRNPPFIDKATQNRLATLSIGLIGCGLASQVAVALTRIGISKFRIWDFDTIEINNLNRQGFTVAQIGENKALATARLIADVNPSAVINVIEDRFSSKYLREGIDGLDIIVNSIDFEDPVLYDISDVLQKRGSWCIQPLNLGFGGCCVVLGPNSPSLNKITRGRQASAAGFIQNLLESCTGFAPSQELQTLAPSLIASGEFLGWFPQNIVATLITTSLITWSVVQIACGLGVKIQAPRLLHFEPRL